MAKIKKSIQGSESSNKLLFKDLVGLSIEALNKKSDELKHEISELKKGILQGNVHNYKSYSNKRRERAQVMTAISLIKREDK